MENKFIELYLYTNQTSLKRYLTYNEICVSTNDDSKETSLSDDGYDGLLLFNREVLSSDIVSRCTNDNYEISVVIKFFIDSEKSVIGIKENGERVEGKLKELNECVAFLIKESISFSNVKKIESIDKKLEFLQGDSTINVPSKLMSENLYSPSNPISSETLENILSSFKSDSNEELIFEESDDFDEDSLDYNFDSNSTFVVDETPNHKNKFLSALLMLIQGNKPLKNNLNANTYFILSDNTDFKSFILEKIYTKANFDIREYIDKVDESLIRYYNDLKDIACNKNESNSLYSSAIKALLNLKYDDKEEFKTSLLNEIKDETLKVHVNECLNDLKARNRIKSLSDLKDDMLPIYTLYVFFEYGFDRLNQNILEFGLNNSASVSILLSLWALKNGMNFIYEEFKNPEILYACDKKVSTWLNQQNDIIPIDKFFECNKITLNQEEFIINDSYRVSYINANIEFEYCVGEINRKIYKLLETLEKLLAKTFGFQFVNLKEAIRQYHLEKLNTEQYREQIHKKYLSMFNKKSKKKSSKKSNNKESIKEEPITLFNYNEGDKRND